MPTVPSVVHYVLPKRLHGEVDPTPTLREVPVDLKGVPSRTVRPRGSYRGPLVPFPGSSSVRTTSQAVGRETTVKRSPTEF